LPAKIDELVPESKDKLEEVTSVGDRFVALYLHDAHSAVKLFKFDGSADGEIKLPGPGTAAGFTGKRKDRETFYSFASFATPTEIFRYDFDKRASELLFKPKVKFNPDDYTTEQVFYKSADGTRIPLFISYKKGMKRNGQNPTYLYGYGGFDISSTPNFTPANLVWMEMGGIYVVANLRGGGEYGEKWDEAGMLHVKQNVFDELIGAGPYDIAKECCYPATMITTADHDDRVVPAHSFKFAATLQAAQGCDKPTLIRIETKAGHGAGKPTTKIIEETADRWSFLVKELGMKMAK